MAELDKTISVIESWLKQPVLTPPPINELYDALELLKEQEVVKPKIDAFGHPYCPKCKMLVFETWEFCPHCGKKMKWG